MALDFYQVITTRRSIRKYKSSPVEEEKLQRILEMARLAPSARNYQPWHFIVIRDEKIKNGLQSVYDRNGFIARRLSFAPALNLP